MSHEVYSLITVTRIESYVDQNGRRGKRIEFSVINPRIEEETYTPESRIIKEVVTQLKSIGIPFVHQQQRNIKLILYILPEEEKALDIDFKVNSIYKMVFRNGAIYFEDVTNKYYYLE